MTESDINGLAADCEKCADHYEEKPGTVSHLTTCDLYRTIARLARIIERQQAELNEATDRRPR
jgi:hypothetical protein